MTELLLFDEFLKVLYYKSCKLFIDSEKKCLKVTYLKEKEEKSITTSVGQNFFRQRNIICIFKAEKNYSGLALIFPFEIICKQTFESLLNYNVQLQMDLQNLLKQRLILLLFNEIENNLIGPEPRLAAILNDFIETLPPEEKQKFLSFKRPTTKNSINIPTNYVFDDSGNSSRKNAEDESLKEETSEFSYLDGNDPTSSSFSHDDDNYFNNQNMEINVNIDSPTIDDDPLSTLNIASGASPSNHTSPTTKLSGQIIKKPYFELKISKAKKPRLIIFASMDKTLCYEYFYNAARKNLLCCGCVRMRKWNAAKIYQNSEGEDYVYIGSYKHFCKARKYKAEKYFPELLKAVNFDLVYEYSDFGELEIKLFVFTWINKNLRWKYLFCHESQKFECCECKSLKQKIVNAKILQNSNGEDYVNLGNMKHICKPKNYPSETLSTKNIIHHRNFEVTRNKINGKQNNSKIFLFLNNERKFGYLYRKSKDNEYLCSECARKWKNVSAKLFHEGSLYYLELDNNMHICNLILYNPFEGYKYPTFISPSPLFGQSGGSSNNNNSTNGISSGFIPPQKQSNQISPTKIRKTKKNNSITSPTQNGFGTNGISSGFASPSSAATAQIQATSNPSQIITINNQISYKLINCNKNGLKTKRLLVYISPELHYEYYFSPSENGYFCSKCLLKTHWTKATFCYDSAGGKEYLDLGENRHICEPLKTANIDYSNNIPFEEIIDDEMEFLDQGHEVANDNNYFESPEILMSDETTFNLTQDSHDNCDDDGNTYVDQKVVYSPNYEISDEFAFGSNTPQKLTLFCFQDKNLCYEYFWNEKNKCFYCSLCEKNFKSVVSARLMERLDAPAYILLGSEKHRCTPIIHIPEEQVSVVQSPDESSRPCSSKSLTPRKNHINTSIKNDIIKQENFIIKNAENGEKLLIIFPINENYQLCYAYDFHKANCYYCRECKKLDLYNYAWLCQTQSGHENYVMFCVKEHICELQSFSSLQIKSIFDES